MSRNYSDQEIIEKFQKSVSCLISNDSYLLRKDVQERSVTHKLAEYLRMEFPGWHVDCEYNRDADKIKKRPNKSPFNPDIIVHKRGPSNVGKNLLVIEAKKSSGEDNNEDERLQEATSPKYQYRYQLGILIIFGVLDQFDKSPVLKFFKKGAEVSLSRLLS